MKARVTTALGLLIGAKLLNVQVPFIFKDAVNYLNEHTGDLLALSDPASTVATTAFSLMIACKWPFSALCSRITYLWSYNLFLLFLWEGNYKIPKKFKHS